MGRPPQNIFSFGRRDNEVVVDLALSDISAIYSLIDIPCRNSILDLSRNPQATSSPLCFPPLLAAK